MAVRWSTFRYRMSGGASATRVAVWRALKAAKAQKLSLGLWAVGHDEDDDPGLRETVRRVIEAGGLAETSIVCPDNPSYADLMSRLHEACDREWSEFFNDVDRISSTHTDPASSNTDLDRLRADYSQRIAADLAQSGAMRRAGDRLDALVTKLSPAPPSLETAGARRVRDIYPLSTYTLQNGMVRQVIGMSPFPTVAWELGFAEFETVLYVPSHEPVALRHGSFVLAGPPDAIGEALVAVRRRIGRFEQYLG